MADYCFVCGTRLKAWQIAKGYKKCLRCYRLPDCSIRCKKITELREENEKRQKKISKLEAEVTKSEVENFRLKRLLKKGEYRALICDRLVASSIAKQTIHSLLKKMDQNPEINKSYSRVLDKIASLPEGHVFHQQQLLREMGWYKTSFGDLMRAALDHLNCNGIITKTRFTIGKPGHAYQKKTRPPCKFLGADGKCVFDFSLGKSVRKEDAMEDE